jgi:kanamycin kinase/aminoglycoside 3'-phosphotransferase-3
MLNNEFPLKIQQYIRGMDCKKDTLGRSESSIYCFSNKDKALYLKVGKSNPEFTHEQDIIQWLQPKLPVPQIIAQGREQSYDYFLMSKAIGEMACSDLYLRNPVKLVQLLADGINALQEVDISDCPFDSTLEKKLEIAKQLIEHNEVDTSDWEESTPFHSPNELYEYLVANKPQEELCFTHGDYCLPNVFFDMGKVSGYIDLGRAGIADKWFDIAICVRSLEYNLKSKDYTNLFFESLGIKPNYEKINYYILLDELF